MSFQSPMMRRMKEKRFRSESWISKKGIFRVLLIIIAVVIGINVFGAIVNKDNSTKISKPQKPDKKNTDRKKAEKKKGTAESNVGQPKYQFTFDDIGKMVQPGNCHYDNETDTISAGGKAYRFDYSIDSSLQKLGKRLMNQYHPKYGAVVAIEPSTGRVLSLLSYENDSVPKICDNHYCKSTFPAASVFKTVTAAAAIEKANYRSESVVRHVGRKATLYKYQLTKELSSFTELPFEEAYANSINPVFARIGMYVLGEGVITDYAGRLGFNTQIPFELPCDVSPMKNTDTVFNLAELACGFNENTRLTPLLGAMIAGSICENGRMMRPSIVDSVTKYDNVKAYRRENEIWRTPLREGTARELRSMMQAVARNGTARKSFRLIRNTSIFDSVEYGGKTGSVDKDTTGRVDWFIGFARNPYRSKERIAVGIVTVHGAYWTVHSSYIAAEYFRVYIAGLRKKEKMKNDSLNLEAKQSKGVELSTALNAGKHLNN